MRKLHMTFLNEDGSKKTLVIKCVDQDLSPAAVKEAMEQIVELDLFEKDGVRLMTEVYSAKYVEIIETPLFEEVNETALPVPTLPVEETEAVYQTEVDTDASNHGVEKQEGDVAEGATQAEPTSKPKKQLAKIYPFMTREEWELKKANHRKNQNRAHQDGEVAYVNQPDSSTELIELLFVPDHNKVSVDQIAYRGRGDPENFERKGRRCD